MVVANRTIAKRGLNTGKVLDGIGGFTSYGVLENYDVSRVQRCLPMGLSENRRVAKAIKKDEVITYSDVELPAGRICDKLREEQNSRFDR